MNKLAVLLDWLDETAGALIRMAYLIAGITAVAVYFGAGELPGRFEAVVNSALPWALAFALETHTYLTARRVRAAWQERNGRALRVNLAVLIGLVGFSAWNQLGYLYGVWIPPTQTPLALPVWIAYVVRALIVPIAFLAAAFLAPLAPPITAQIEAEARATLADVFRIARRQRRRLLRTAERTGQDMTCALVDLVADPETRRIIAHAYAAIRAPGQRPPSPASPRLDVELPALAHPASVDASNLHDGDESLLMPQTAASAASGSKNGTKRSARSGSRREPPLTPHPVRRRQRTQGQSGRRWSTAEQRVRAVVSRNPHTSFDDVVRLARVSPSTASKWLKVIAAERNTEVQLSSA